MAPISLSTLERYIVKSYTNIKVLYSYYIIYNEFNRLSIIENSYNGNLAPFIIYPDLNFPNVKNNEKLYVSTHTVFGNLLQVVE